MVVVVVVRRRIKNTEERGGVFVSYETNPPRMHTYMVVSLSTFPAQMAFRHHCPGLVPGSGKHVSGHGNGIRMYMHTDAEA